MKTVFKTACVDRDLCNGDKICENICPAAAIKVIDKKAVVDESHCLACLRCKDVCPKDAVTMRKRDEPLVLAMSTEGLVPEELDNLCAKANLKRHDIVCICTMATAEEIAAAVLKGAKTPVDVSRMTGLRSACGMWCIAPILRVMEAHGLDLPESDGYRWYNIKADLWNTGEEVDKKYPEYRLEEDKELFRKGIFHNLPNH